MHEYQQRNPRRSGQGQSGRGPRQPHRRYGGPGRGRHGWPRHHQEWDGGRAPFRRRFFTREERIAFLEEYLKKLQAEAKGVEERIAALKAGE